MTIILYINQLTIYESICAILPCITIWGVGSAFLYKRKCFKTLRVISGILFAIWAYSTWEYTTFGREMGERAFSLVPLAQLYQVVRFDDYGLMMSAWFNVLLFLPGGVLLPELLSASYEMRRRLTVVAVCAFAMSVMIEMSQGIWGLGLVETDDVMCNTLGACVGYGCYWVKCKGLQLEKQQDGV